MARTNYSRNSYVGGAPQAKLLSNITESDTTITLTNTTSYWNTLGKSGADDAGFFLCISIGTTNEEKVYVPGGVYSWTDTSVTLSGVTRGVDGTPASAHAAADSVTPVMTATDLNEANYAVTETIGKITAQGDLLYGNGANTLAKLAAGTAGKVLTSNGASAAPSWEYTSNVWSGSTSYSVSGYKYYLVIADVTVTQPSTGMVAGALTLTAGSKTVVQSYPVTASWVENVSLSTVVTSSGTINVTATKSAGATGTVGTPTLTVIGMN